MKTTHLDHLSESIPSGRTLARGSLFLLIFLLVVVIGTFLFLADGLFDLLISLSWIQGTIVLLLAGYDRLIRPWHMRWRATKREVSEELPGDELSDTHFFRSTRAITIKAPVEDVWPWLVQIGWKKGGFYSYSWLERLFGMQLHNANTIHDEWQGLDEGDEVWVAPDKYGDSAQLQVYTMTPEKTLVLATAVNGGWSFHLRSIDGTTTRLITRFHLEPTSAWGQLFHYTTLEPIHFIMERGMLKGIKKRAEKRRKVKGKRLTRP